MSTFTQIKTFRLDICDPVGYNDIISVAATANLPATPVKGSAYYVVATGLYLYTEKTSGAVAADYFQCELQLTDSRIGSWIDAQGADLAIVSGLRAIMRKLGSEMKIVQNSAGAESVQFTDLSSMYSFYKHLLDDAQAIADAAAGTVPGTMYQTLDPEVAGGNV